MYPILIVLDQVGRIKAPDPWKGHTSRCHMGYIYTDPQITVKAYPLYYGKGANWMFDGSWVDRAR